MTDDTKRAEKLARDWCVRLAGPHAKDTATIKGLRILSNALLTSLERERKAADELKAIMAYVSIESDETARQIIDAWNRRKPAPGTISASQAEHDVITLCLRLCLEPSDSHAPETRDVLERWRSAWEAAAGGMDIYAAIDAARKQEDGHE